MLAFAILDWLDAGRTSPRRASAITITGLDQTIKKANKDRTYKRIHILVSILILDKDRMIEFCIPRQLEWAQLILLKYLPCDLLLHQTDALERWGPKACVPREMGFLPPGTWSGISGTLQW